MNWRESGDTTFAAWDALLPATSQIKKRGESRACYEAARPLSRLCLGMLKGESSFATDFDAVPAWMNNPLNLKDPYTHKFIQFDSIAACITHWRERITSPTYKQGVYANTVTVRDLISVYAPGYDNNNVPGYTATVEGVINSLPRYISAPAPAEEKPMNIPYPAPPVQVSIIPFANSNRPKLVMDPEYITVHEVGNTSPGADEEMHRRFTHNGGGPANVSFGFVVGPSKVIQLLPLDEASWHASDGYNGTGNRRSIAIETIQIGDFNKTLWNLAWLINELATNPGRFYANRPRSDWKLSIERIKQHYDWAPDKKNCPQFIRDRGLWPELMRRVDAWNAVGQDPIGVPYAKPITYDWLDPEIAEQGYDRKIGNTTVYYLPMTYTAVKQTPRRQATCKNTEVIGPPVEPGERFKAWYVYRSCNKTYVLTQYGTRIAAADLEPKVQISLRGTISVRKTASSAPEIARKGE